MRRVTRAFACTLMALLVGCSPVASVAFPQASPATRRQSLSGITMSKAIALTAVQAELRDFLEVWRTKGYATASAAYLVPSQRLLSSEAAPVLTSGRVAYWREDQWTSADDFVVYVDFDLTFSGNSGAWGTGTNSRFVTATSRAGTIPFVLELATSR